MIESGAADRSVGNKRQLVSTNRRAAERALGASRIEAHPMSPHLWISLPTSMEAHELADRARLRGIAVAPSAAFAIDRNAAANEIRISIGATTDARQLKTALRTVASLIENPRMGSVGRTRTTV
jgi:DNA-binding transcriptional MocR family regulator